MFNIFGGCVRNGCPAVRPYRRLAASGGPARVVPHPAAADGRGLRFAWVAGPAADERGPPGRGGAVAKPRETGFRSKGP
jgi:hypothetical protein